MPPSTAPPKPLPIDYLQCEIIFTDNKRKFIVTIRTQDPTPNQNRDRNNS